MRSLIRAALLGLATVGTLPLIAATATPAEAQILRRVKEAAQRAAERETERQVDRAVTETIRCTVGDDACRERAEREGKQVEMVDRSGNVVSGNAASPADAAATPGAPAAATAFVNYDFVPGERILFTEDFARDNVGDFPRRLEFIEGNMEVAEWNGGRWLRGTTWPNKFAIVLPEQLPDRFTLELEIAGGKAGHSAFLYFDEEPQHRLHVRYFNDALEGGVYNVSDGRTREKVPAGSPFMMRVMADGRYVKVYLNGTRVANMPNANLGRSTRIIVEAPSDQDDPVFIRDIRVAAGGRALYDALSAEGRVATQGILFDTGSDRIRPESAPTLKEIGEMLKAHPDLRLSIEGHTDNVGDDAANMALSERRAAAVKAHLEREYGIAADRLQAKGMGETKPVASNDTPEGRQQNRRVELVKQ